VRSGWLVVIAASAGCGDNLVPTGPVDGARLAVAYATYADGTRQLAVGRLRDTERRETCTPARWSDGFTYCTPAATPTVYADAACTQELALAGATYALHTYVLDGVPRPSRLYLPGDPVAAPAAIYELVASCTPATIPDGASFVALGDEVPRTALVHLIPEEPTGPARIGQRYITSGDGLRAPLALVDRTLGVDCTAEELPGAPTARCVPTGAVTAAYFHDDACTVPEVSALVAPSFVAVTTASCTGYFATGEQVFDDTIYLLGAQCFAGPIRLSEVQYLAGAALDLATLARTQLAGGDRIAPLALGELYGAAMHAVDLQLGVECSPGPIAGALRCLPATAPAIEEFADPLCQTPISIAEVPVRACDPAVAFARRGDEIAPIGAASPQRYELTTGETCRPYMPPLDHALFELGAPLAPEAFVAVSDP